MDAPVTPWMENDVLARRMTEMGWKWQRMVGAFFEAKDLHVVLPPYSWRETREDIPLHNDSLDLIVEGHRIEVKSRDLDFSTDPRTFPYERAFVDTVSSYDSHAVKPLAYVFVSQRTGAMLSTPGRHPDAVASWTQTRAFDHVRKIHDMFYLVGREWLTPIDVLVARLRDIKSLPSTTEPL